MTIAVTIPTTTHFYSLKGHCNEENIEKDALHFDHKTKIKNKGSLKGDEGGLKANDASSTAQFTVTSN